MKPYLSGRPGCDSGYGVGTDIAVIMVKIAPVATVKNLQCALSGTIVRETEPEVATCVYLHPEEAVIAVQTGIFLRKNGPLHAIVTQQADVLNKCPDLACAVRFEMKNRTAYFGKWIPGCCGIKKCEYAVFIPVNTVVSRQPNGGIGRDRQHGGPGWQGNILPVATGSAHGERALKRLSIAGNDYRPHAVIRRDVHIHYGRCRVVDGQCYSPVLPVKGPEARLRCGINRAVVGRNNHIVYDHSVGAERLVPILIRSRVVTAYKTRAAEKYLPVHTDRPSIAHFRKTIFIRLPARIVGISVQRIGIDAAADPHGAVGVGCHARL